MPKVFYLLPLMAFCLISSASELPVIRIGCQIVTDTPKYQNFISDSLKDIEEQLKGKYRVEIENLTSNQLRKKIESHEIDYFISDSMFYLGVSASSGPNSASRLAVLWHPRAVNPTESEGGTIISLKSEENKTLLQLEGQTLAAKSERDYVSYGALRREIFELHKNPKHFFDSVSFLGSYDDVIDSVISGKSDLGIIPTCYIEEHNLDPRMKEIKPQAVKNQKALSCFSSTRLYLGLVFAASYDADPYLNRLILAELLDTPAHDGFVWTVGGDISQGHELFKALNEEQYEKLSRSALMRHLEEKSPYILAALGALILFFIHWFSVNRLVEKRTRQLIKAQKETDKIKEQFAAMQRVGVIGLMSSTLSHELKQPISVIGNYLQGMRLLRKSGRMTDKALDESIENIGAQIERANSIIKKVRSYAGKKSSERKPTDLKEIIERSISDLLKTRTKRTEISFKPCRETVIVDADETELHLAVHNIIKNAVEACEEQPSPLVGVSLSIENGKAVFAVTDNGPILAPEAIENIKKPLWTSKKNGMGLGIPIVSRIAEAHRGSLTFDTDDKGSLVVTLRLPLTKESKNA